MIPSTTSKLHLLRHAHSSWAVPGQRDHLRPLDERGRRDAAALARELRAHPRRIDRVVCSTATRAAQTFERVRDALPAGFALEWSDALYAEGVEAYLAAIGASAGRVLLVGHNPTLEALVARLAPAAAPALAAKLREGIGTANWVSLRREAPAEGGPAWRLAAIWRP